MIGMGRPRVDASSRAEDFLFPFRHLDGDDRGDRRPAASASLIYLFMGSKVARLVRRSRVRRKLVVIFGMFGLFQWARSGARKAWGVWLGSGTRRRDDGDDDRDGVFSAISWFASTAVPDRRSSPACHGQSSALRRRRLSTSRSTGGGTIPSADDRHERPLGEKLARRVAARPLSALIRVRVS